MGNGGHAGGDAAAKDQAHHQHGGSLVPLLDAQHRINLLNDGEIDHKQHCGRDEQSQEDHREEEQPGELPGAFLCHAAGYEPDCAAPYKGGLGERIGTQEGEHKECKGGIAKGGRQHCVYSQFRDSCQSRHTEQAGPVDGNCEPQQQSSQENADHPHGGLGHASRSGQESEAEDQQQRNCQNPIPGLDCLSQWNNSSPMH